MGWESSVIDDALLLQRLQKTAYVFANLNRISPAKSRRKRTHDLQHRALSVAELQNILPRPLNPNHAFRKKHHAFLALSAPPATGSETRLTGIGRTRHAQDSQIRKAPGG